MSWWIDEDDVSLGAQEDPLHAWVEEVLGEGAPPAPAMATALTDFSSLIDELSALATEADSIDAVLSASSRVEDLMRDLRHAPGPGDPWCGLPWWAWSLLLEERGAGDAYKEKRWDEGVDDTDKEGHPRGWTRRVRRAGRKGWSEWWDHPALEPAGIYYNQSLHAGGVILEGEDQSLPTRTHRAVWRRSDTSEGWEVDGQLVEALRGGSDRTRSLLHALDLGPPHWVRSSLEAMLLLLQRQPDGLSHRAIGMRARLYASLWLPVLMPSYQRTRVPHRHRTNRTSDLFGSLGYQCLHPAGQAWLRATDHAACDAMFAEPRAQERFHALLESMVEGRVQPEDTGRWFGWQALHALASSVLESSQDPETRLRRWDELLYQQPLHERLAVNARGFLRRTKGRALRQFTDLFWTVWQNC